MKKCILILFALSFLLFFESLLEARKKNTTVFRINVSKEASCDEHPTLIGVGAEGAEVLCITQTDTTKFVYDNLPLILPDIPYGTKVIFRASYEGHESQEQVYVAQYPEFNVGFILKKKKN